MDRLSNVIVPTLESPTSFSSNSTAKSFATREALSALDTLVDRELNLFEDLLAEQLESEYHCVAQVMNSAIALQGKRLRPRLVFLSALACGGVTETTRRVAAVVELVHAATLVHDDVIDNSDTRRGAPTTHVTWGNRASILLGDILFSKAYIMAASVGSCYAAERVGRAGQALCEGELRQQSTISRWDMPLDEYIDILSQKTGDLCAASSLLGAWSVNASRAWLIALERYGAQLGIAFQIFDDWLDVWGTASTGKPVGNDIANRKPTLPTIHLLQSTPEHARERVIALLDKGELSAELHALLQQCEASEATLDRARLHAKAACDAIDILPDSVAKHALISVAQNSIRRTR